MNKKILIFTGLVVLAFVFGLKGNSFKSEAQTVLSNEVAATPSYELPELIKQAGAVEIKVKPSQLEVGKDIVFTVTLDTHSVELNYDLVELVSLEDGLGNNYQPQAWSGGKGGHHLSGELAFARLRARAKSLKLTIDGIENQQLVFEWEL